MTAIRNDPQVARYLTYELPHPREEVERAVARSIELGEPSDEGWWLGAVCDRENGQYLGDLGVGLTWKGRTAELGFVFGAENWGHGYVVEAAWPLVEYLYLERKVTRVFGMLHPDNPASAMVLERLGMTYEGHTKSSFWVGQECSDDLIYGMIYQGWEAWHNRPRETPNEVALVEIDPDNIGRVAALATHKSQERFVAPMGDSFGDALFPEMVDGAPLVPWMRAIAADDEIVGFVMVAESTDAHPDPYLWRLLIDRMHQRRQIGARAVALVEAEFLRRGDTTLFTSWEEGKGTPAPFYSRLGFTPTGRLVDGEVEASKPLR